MATYGTALWAYEQIKNYNESLSFNERYGDDLDFIEEAEYRKEIGRLRARVKVIGDLCPDKIVDDDSLNLVMR
jgi:hypothetical protein